MCTLQKLGSKSQVDNGQALRTCRTSTMADSFLLALREEPHMAILIPALSSCAGRMTPGESRLAARLEQKLDDDYLLWFDVPVGPKQAYPDFVILHPRRGILILETKHWQLDTIRSASRTSWEIFADGRLKTVASPLEQARHCAIQVVNALERDPQLVQQQGPHQGKLAFAWGHGVVLTQITRKQFEAAELDQAMDPQRVICADEMPESVDPEDFQKRLWQMFPHAFGELISLPNLDRVRWILFPEVRVPDQGALFDADDLSTELPSLMKVMDLQQEQLARSLGDGHRVIHGVAGSGKTMILSYRAEHLAKACSHTSKPILALCFNEPLGVQLDATFAAKGIADRVHARNFHKWCWQQLRAYGQEPPKQGPAMFDEMVDRVIRAVERGFIPAGQYQAVLVDEGHDFRPEWLKLITQMVDPTSNSLLVLYDDAQSIYERSHRKRFSFKSVGIQAQGRTTILKISYRNTRQILQLAQRIAADLLDGEDEDDDGVPLVRPISSGSEGRPPLVIRLPSLREEAFKIAEHLATAHSEGHAWSDMAVLCRDWAALDLCAEVLRAKHLPHQIRKRSGDFRPLEDSIKLLTMKVSKGLEFPVVALHGVGHMPSAGEDEREQARIFYVAATRATEQLLITVSGDGAFGRRLLNEPLGA